MDRIVESLHKALGDAIVDIGALELEVVQLEAQISALKKDMKEANGGNHVYKTALEIYNQCGDWSKIEFIKALRTATGLDLRECKDIADTLKFWNHNKKRSLSYAGRKLSN